MIAELLSDYITAFISSIGYWGVFILMMLESAALPVPSEVVMPFAGYLSYLGTFNLVLISFVGAAGCAAGSVLSYLVGLKGGRPFLERYGKYFFFEHKYLDLAEKWFYRYGDKAVFFSRLLPVIRTFISFPAGIGKYNFKKLVAFSFIGSLPWCFALAYAGYRLGPYWKDIIKFFNGLDIVIIVAFVILAVYFWKFKKSLISD
ncbi:MAG: DedA family protein [Candidatus Methanoperedens sp.]|nr:DedA family protein [Candidatus Methanoperedens sp.]MCZ7369199.1 DedA family protein [Candidatus Methanoperedens sp.]